MCAVFIDVDSLHFREVLVDIYIYLILQKKEHLLLQKILSHVHKHVIATTHNILHLVDLVINVLFNTIPKQIKNTSNINCEPSKKLFSFIYEKEQKKPLGKHIKLTRKSPPKKLNFRSSSSSSNSGGSGSDSSSNVRNNSSHSLQLLPGSLFETTLSFS